MPTVAGVEDCSRQDTRKFSAKGAGSRCETLGWAQAAKAARCPLIKRAEAQNARAMRAQFPVFLRSLDRAPTSPYQTHVALRQGSGRGCMAQDYRAMRHAEAQARLYVHGSSANAAHAKQLDQVAIVPIEVAHPNMPIPGLDVLFQRAGLWHIVTGETARRDRAVLRRDRALLVATLLDRSFILL